MVLLYRDYEIEVINDEDYSVGSADNQNQYNFQYLDDNNNHEFASKHGIKVRSNDVEIASAIIVGSGSSTTIHAHSFVLKNNVLFICCGDSIFSLDLPTLTLNWNNELDAATCFGIYEYEDDFIIHGECEISRLTESGNIKWQFSGRDIFVNLEGKKEFKIVNNQIRLADFQGYEYILNSKGEEDK